MKSIFGLLRQAQLGLISLLPIVVGCLRNAPRNEPTPLVGQNSSQQDPTSIITPGIQPIGKEIPKDSGSYASILDKLRTNYSNLQDKNIGNFFKAIGLSEDLTIKDLQDPSNGLTSKQLPNKLFFFFESNQKDTTCYATLTKPEPIFMVFNPLSPNSDKHSYVLVGFLMDTSEKLDIAEENDSQDPLIACLKKEDQWCYYNKHYTKKTDFPTKNMMELASEKGMIFFYRKEEVAVQVNG